MLQKEEESEEDAEVTQSERVKLCSKKLRSKSSYFSSLTRIMNEEKVTKVEHNIHSKMRSIISFHLHSSIRFPHTNHLDVIKD